MWCPAWCFDAAAAFFRRPPAEPRSPSEADDGETVQHSWFEASAGAERAEGRSPPPSPGLSPGGQGTPRGWRANRLAERYSQNAFVNALRAVLGLDPIEAVTMTAGAAKARLRVRRAPR